MQMSLRLMRFMRIFMLAALVVIILLPEWLHPHPDHPAPKVIFFAITGLACVDVAIAFFMHRIMIRRATPVLAANPEDNTGLNQWRVAYVMAFGFAIAIGLFGLVLRFIGFSLGQVAPFYVAGIGLLLYFNPRAPVNQG
jgi:hypothetical protein